MLLAPHHSGSGKQLNGKRRCLFGQAAAASDDSAFDFHLRTTPKYLVLRPPAMNKFWEIQELLLSILEHLGRGDRARMAQVCRYFWSTALPMVWQTLPLPHDNRPLWPFLLEDTEHNEAEGDTFPQMADAPLKVSPTTLDAWFAVNL